MDAFKASKNILCTVGDVQFIIIYDQHFEAHVTTEFSRVSHVEILQKSRDEKVTEPVNGSCDAEVFE